MIDKSKINRETATIDDIEFYNDYINKIRDRMERPDFIGTFSDSEVKFFLTNNSYIYWYKYNGDMVSSAMIIPSTKRDISNFGLDIDYHSVIDYGPQVVSEDYRGNGMQGYMIDDLDKISRKLGYKYAVSTAHPENIVSIKNLEGHGFKLVGYKVFSRGPRNIYLKSLTIRKKPTSKRRTSSDKRR